MLITQQIPDCTQNYYTYPRPCGYRGVGVVISTGKSHEKLLNHEVHFGSSVDSEATGSWAEYCVCQGSTCTILQTTLEKGVYLYGNPQATEILFYHLKDTKCKKFVLNIGTSALGKMINQMALKRDYTVINVVRKDKNIKVLKDLGVEHV